MALYLPNIPEFIVCYIVATLKIGAIAVSGALARRWKEIHFVQELPKSATGKILKRVLKEQHAK